MLERDNSVVGVCGNNIQSKTSWLGVWGCMLLENLVRHFLLAAVLHITSCHMLLIRQNSNAEEAELWQSLWLCLITGVQRGTPSIIFCFLLVMTM